MKSETQNVTKENLINKSINFEDKKKNILIIKLENDKNNKNLLESEGKKLNKLSNKDITNKKFDKFIINKKINNTEIIENNTLNKEENENEKQIKHIIYRKELQKNKKNK